MDKASVCNVSVAYICNLNDVDVGTANAAMTKWTNAFANAATEVERATAQVGIAFHKKLLWALDNCKSQDGHK